jgi:hypothetical protein
MMVLMQCEQCGETFESKKAWASFCGSKCRLQAHRERKRRPTYELELALLQALKQLRAGEVAEAIKATKAAIAKVDTPQPKAKRRKKKKASKPKKKKRNETDVAALLIRYEVALAAGVKSITIANGLELSSSSVLSRWRSGAKPLSPAMAKALGAWLDVHEARQRKRQPTLWG